MRRCIPVLWTLAILLLAGRSDAATSSEACELLADPHIRLRMSATLELKLIRQCEGPEALVQPPAPVAEPAPLTQAAEGGTDILVNDPALDSGGTTQSETSVVAAGDVVCAAWNDSGEGFGANGFSGFGFSTDGGATWSDGGPFPNGPGDSNSGDPSLAYSVRDDAFYYAALSDRGLSMWASTDGCESFSYVGSIHVGGGDDKELMAVDNEPSSPFFGRIYVGWTNFSLSFDRNQTTHSDDGGLSWSLAVSLPGSGTDGQGMWPAVAPNGDVYFALLDRSFSIGGLENHWIYKSTNGGDSWTRSTDIASNQRRPEDTSASASCNRQALGGFIRNLSSPQIAIHPDPGAPAGYVIHAVYPSDPDNGGPDESDVSYRRSVDGALSWSPALRLNDDATTTDQFFPAVGVNENGFVAVSWYDRRLDPGNLLFDRFAVTSSDGGVTFGENVRVSDVSSPVSQNLPHFDGLATCYHGDYDELAVDASRVHIVWSDDRRLTPGPNPDVYYDQLPVAPSVDIDASAAFATNLFGNSSSAISNPLPFDVPVGDTAPLLLRTDPFEIVLTVSQGLFVDPLPSIGPSGSGADIEAGDALVGMTGEWALTLAEGTTGDRSLVLLATPPVPSAPVVEGALLSIEADAIVADDLEALSPPGSQLALTVDSQEPESDEPIQGAGVLLATTVPGVIVDGEPRVVDNLGELDSTGTRSVIQSSEVQVGVDGVCFGFPSGGLFGSPNCIGDAFQLDPTNDLLIVNVAADSLDPFLASAGSGISVVGGGDCEASPVLASLEGPQPSGRTFVQFVFPPSSAEGESLSICLIQNGLTPVPTGDVDIGISLDFSSVFLLDPQETNVSIEIVERCFGDFNRDGRVNNTDALYFRGCFPCTGGGCDRQCDADLNGTVNNFDALQFRRNFGSECPVP